jgi:two-component system, chemotaxis family, sensor kinase CheA
MRTRTIVRSSSSGRYALRVAAIHDHEELVIKPAAPMIMATGLYAGTTLPDNGRPVLLLDVQGLLAAAGVDASEAGRVHDASAEAAAEAAAARDAAQLLLFREASGRTRGVRLSVIERVEEVPASALFESAGVVKAQIGSEIFPVHAATVPTGPEAVKLLRLHDGQSVLCYPIAAVIDIVRLPDAVQPAQAPGLVAGVVLIGGEPVELIDPFWLMAQYSAGQPAPLLRQPLCRLSDDADGWAANFLAPILRNAGYRIITGDETIEGERPDVQLCLIDEHVAPVAADVPLVRLRSSVAATGPEDDSIYRYDRGALLEALRIRVAGAGS